jgi:hypothetical protein
MQYVPRDLVFDIHVIVKWSNIYLSGDAYGALLVYSRHTMYSKTQFWWNGHGIHTPRILRYYLNPRYCNSRAGSAAGNVRYIILMDFIQTLISFDDWSSFYLRQEA